MQEFSFKLEDNIFDLHERLIIGTWKPDPYIAFYVRDPKLRYIHKATVRDRVFNQALFRILYPIFDRHFVFGSFSCRKGKGTHKGVFRLQKYIRNISLNYTKPAFALKCDVKKFFDNIDHKILINLIKMKVVDQDVLEIIDLIIKSFETKSGKGLPLGNVTSQLFANIYLNELDQFVKHVLKIKYYVRYCDDFVILDESEEVLQKHINKIGEFLQNKLQLSLHPDKITIRKCVQGVDFLGYVILPHRIVVRTKTKNRMLRKVNKKNLQSYLGILSHCAGYKIRNKILNVLSLR